MASCQAWPPSRAGPSSRSVVPARISAMVGSHLLVASRRVTALRTVAQSRSASADSYTCDVLGVRRALGYAAMSIMTISAASDGFMGRGLSLGLLRLLARG